MMRWLLVLSVLAGFASTEAGAQGVLRGKVLRDATRAPIAGAEVTIVDSDQRATTDSAGAFAIDELPAGWTVVLIRKVGFTSRRDTVNIRGNGPTVREYLLASIGQLDTVKTLAAETKYISPGLRGFEERRTNATAGHFITEAELRKQDEKNIAGVIVQKAPGLHVLAQRNSNYIVSSRKECAGPVFAQGSKNCEPCYVTTYLDGQLIYEAGRGIPPMDFSRMGVNEFAAVEFYPGSGTAPAQFGRTSSGCGVLLLWTRER